MTPSVAAFLEQAGWAQARITPMQADFSPRRYARLERADGRRAILMQAAADQKTPAFVAIACLLRDLELSAPVLYAAEPDNGLVLMEDFGDRNFGALLDAGEDAWPLYRRATDVLAHLHQAFDAANAMPLPLFDAALFTAQAELFLDAYIPFAQSREATPGEREGFRAAWLEALKPLDSLPQTLLLRDYMPDNLMDLPEREAWRGVGVLDFQDAGRGPIAYDLASLCEAVRRDGGPALQEDVLAQYHRQNPAVALPDLRRACRVLAAQRHTRILGIIARLAQQGRREKLALLPRVGGYLATLLKDDALRDVAKIIGTTESAFATRP